MSVSDGQPVSASVTNAAYISRLTDSDTIAKVTLANLDVESGATITNTQRLINEVADVQGNTGEGDATAKDYSSNNVVANGDDRKVAIGKLDATFDTTTGHDHDGVNSKAIDSTDLANFNEFFAQWETLEVDNATGTSYVVTTEFAGKTPGGDASTKGVITSSPDNRVEIREKDSGLIIENLLGEKVFARVTEAASVWTLSFFTITAGSETAHNLSLQDIRIYFREVFDSGDRPTIPADIGAIGSTDLTADIVDATPTQAGKVNTVAQSFGGVKTFTSRPTVNGDDIVSETAVQTITSKTLDASSVTNPVRLDIKKDTKANLDTYAATATNGQLAFSTDTKKHWGVVDSALVELGAGAGGGGAPGLDIPNFTINNNVGAPTSITDFVFDNVDTKAVRVQFDISRRTDTQNVVETGEIFLAYDDEASDWRISVDSKFDDAGVTLTVTAAGQVQYTSNDLTGASYSGTMRFGLVSEVEQASTTFAIANNVSVATNITDLTFNSTNVKASRILFDVSRRTDTQNVVETGEIFVAYDSEASDWRINTSSVFDDAGVVFTITSGGQVRYTSSDLTGASYSGFMKRISSEDIEV